MAPLPLAHLVSPVVRGRRGVGETTRTTRHSPNRSTGQDAVAVIKNELKLLIPGIKIFLDVDDLKDIGSLEDYVDRTQVMLFFLSKGYFRSKALPQPLPFRASLCRPRLLVRSLPAELPARDSDVAREEQAARPRARGGPGQGLLATQKAQGSRPKTQDVLEPSRGGSAAAATDDGGSPG